MLSQTPKPFSNQLPVFFQKNKYWAKLLITRCNYILNNFVEWWTFSHCSLLINLGYLCLLQPRCHGKLVRLVSISQTWVSQHSWLFFSSTGAHLQISCSTCVLYCCIIDWVWHLCCFPYTITWDGHLSMCTLNRRKAQTDPLPLM